MRNFPKFLLRFFLGYSAFGWAVCVVAIFLPTETTFALLGQVGGINPSPFLDEPMFNYWLRIAAGAFTLIGGGYLCLAIWPDKYSNLLPFAGFFMLCEGLILLTHGLLLQYTPTDETAIPTGELRPVADTPFDFREPRRIGELIDADDAQIKIGRGYDHNFVIDGKGGTLRPVARVYEPKSGRVMDMFSTDSGVQFYAGNFFDGSVIGKNGKPYTHRIAFCLECQRFPDSPNQPKFSSAKLKAGETYEKTTTYQFSTL